MAENPFAQYATPAPTAPAAAPEGNPFAQYTAAAPAEAPQRPPEGQGEPAEPSEPISGTAAYEQARDRWRAAGYGTNVNRMANDSARQIARGAGQLAEARRFALSGAGRDVVPDSPANRVAGAHSALDPQGPQAPLTTAEHAAANREQVGNVVRGAGNLAQGAIEYVTSPINAALRTAVGQPVEAVTGIPKEYAEFAASLAIPGKLPKLPARQVKPAAPSVDALKKAAKEGYESEAVTGLQIQPKAMSDWATVLRSKLDDSGMVSEIAPGTHAVLKRAGAIPDGAAAVTGTNLDALRKALGGVAKSSNNTERAAAVKAIEALDEFLPAVRSADTISGDPRAAASALQEARGNWSAAQHATTLDKKQMRAELRSAAANSGANIENSIRQQMANILASDKERRGFSGSEIALMERIVYGTPARNTMRTLGNLGGGGLGWGAVATGAAGAAATGSVAGAAVPLVAHGLKRISNALAVRDVEKLNELVRVNSPLGKQMASPLADWSKAAQRFETSPTPRYLASFSIASRNLSNNLKDAGIAISPNDLMMRSIQGPVRGSAEQEQPDAEGVVEAEPNRR